MIGPVRHRVTVRDGLDGVSRVLCLLRQRRYRVTALTAHPAGDGWVLSYAVELPEYEENLLIKRVNRLVSVTKVTECRPSNETTRW
ncbi:MAG TPA: ACT domain-containing protein [Pseudonocardia sp.]|jgi:acetolactate synthase regulatory subunit